MAKYPTRSQLLKDRLDEQSRASAAAQRKNNELEDEVQMLKEQIANGVAEREETRREMQEELEKERNAREQLRQEFLSLLAQQREATLQVIHLYIRISSCCLFVVDGLQQPPSLTGPNVFPHGPYAG